MDEEKQQPKVIWYPVENKNVLICDDGTEQVLSFWETLGLRAGFLSLEQLNKKYHNPNEPQRG